MYSPKISETQVRRLYRLARAQHRPMTHLVGHAIQAYFDQHERPEVAYVITDQGRDALRRVSEGQADYA